MKLHIATPMYGGQCFTGYTDSMLRLVSLTNELGINLSWEFRYNESLIPRARDNAAHHFLKSDATHLMFIDADIKFDPQDVVKMLLADKEVICGIYARKCINWDKVKISIDSGITEKRQLERNSVDWVCTTNTYEEQDKILSTKIPQEIIYGGTGFMLIKREVFEKLKPHVITYTNNTENFYDEKTYGFFQLCVDPETNVLLSEDYFFCNKWRAIGGKVYAAPWAILQHTGTYSFG
jgi:hypothetical protein